MHLNPKKTKTRSTLKPSASSPPLPSPNLSPPTLISPSQPTISPICQPEDNSRSHIKNEDDDVEETMNELDQFTNGATDNAVTNGATDDAVTEVDEDEPVVINLSFNFPKNKVQKIIAISKDKINLSFRLGVDNFCKYVTTDIQRDIE